MSKTFIASVGTARGFDAQGNQILFSNSLTTSGFNISTSKEEVRGGQGGALIGQYYHTSQFGVSMEDALFDLNYLALQVGGKISQGGDIFTTEQVQVDEGNKIKVKGEPQSFGDLGLIGWYNHVGKDERVKIKFSGLGNNEATDSGLKAGEVVCVTYIKHSDTLRQFEVSTAFIPSEIRLVIELPLFNAGAMDKESVSTESQIGKLEVEIPRFQFEGSVDLSSAMASATGVNIGGSAMQANTVGCSAKGIYAIVKEDIFNKDEFDNVRAIVVEDSKLELANEEEQTLVVLAFFNDGTVPKVLDNKKLTFTIASGGQTHARVGANTGVVTGLGSPGTATIEIKVTEHTELEASATVTVS